VKTEVTRATDMTILADLIPSSYRAEGVAGIRVSRESDAATSPISS
jgi:hypothetical protein